MDDNDEKRRRRPTGSDSHDGEWLESVGAKERRRLRARARRENVVWFGLGTFGVVGWSVAIPTIALTLLGVYLDAHYPASWSYTLMLLFAGVVIGCLNAWYWVNRERPGPDEMPRDADGTDNAGAEAPPGSGSDADE
ncbi:MAG TPA: hypothetical protein DGT21_10135 [Armatimonadetes bacterium]|nr:hypothetical protein [Armatimonadota bacterium]